MPNESKKPQLVIFTDLDGSLLDHHSYSYDAAREALGIIQSEGIPLIVCSSKTRAEIEVWRKKLQNRDPFISENGGAIFFPPGMMIPDSYRALERGSGLVVELGIHYPKLLEKYQRLKRVFGEKIRGFSEMGVEEIMVLTGLSREDAEFARRREYTEPFVFSGGEGDEEELHQAVEALHLNLTRGGRFFHLLGDNDKGKAVSIVTEIYRRSHPNLKTIALGDSYNDLPMFKRVDVAVLVQKPDGGYDEKMTDIPNVICACGAGPAGWNKAVLEILEDSAYSDS